MGAAASQKEGYEPGDRCGLDGSYRVVRLIAKGGMGDVFEVIHVPSGRRCALKRLQFRHKQNKVYLDKLQAEAAAGQEMKHPNLVPVFESALDESGGYFVMEYLDGETLAERLGREGALPPIEAFGICAQIADALFALHEAGIVHRDVKPGNIFITRDGRILLLDLGAAKFERYGLNTTQSQGPLGTALYMSPEHAQGEKVDGRSDVFSLGHVLYHALAGHHAFEAFGERFHNASGMNIVMWHATEDVPPLTVAAPELHPVCWDCVKGAVRRKRGDRYRSAADFAAAMRGALTVLRTPAAASSPGNSDVRLRQPSPAVVGPKGTLLMGDSPANLPAYAPNISEEEFQADMARIQAPAAARPNAGPLRQRGMEAVAAAGHDQNTSTPSGSRRVLSSLPLRIAVVVGVMALTSATVLWIAGTRERSAPVVEATATAAAPAAEAPGLAAPPATEPTAARSAAPEQAPSTTASSSSAPPPRAAPPATAPPPAPPPPAPAAQTAPPAHRDRPFPTTPAAPGRPVTPPPKPAPTGSPATPWAE